MYKTGKIGYKPQPLFATPKDQSAHVLDFGDVVKHDVESLKQETYKPQGLDLSNVKRAHVVSTVPKNYEPVSLDNGKIKATRSLKPIVVEDAEILREDPTLISTEVNLVKMVIKSINPNSFRDSILSIGIKEQTSLSEVVEKVGTVANVNTTTITSALDSIKKIVSAIPIKKKLFGPTIDGYIREHKPAIEEHKRTIQTDLPCVVDADCMLQKYSDEIDIAMRSVNMQCIAINIAIPKADGCYKDLFLNRITSLQTTRSIAMQTKQILSVKRQNINNLIMTARDTIFNMLPTIYNQLEIIVLQEQSGKIDETSLKDIVTSQNAIVAAIGGK